MLKLFGEFIQKSQFHPHRLFFVVTHLDEAEARFREQMMKDIHLSLNASVPGNVARPLWLLLPILCHCLHLVALRMVAEQFVCYRSSAGAQAEA
jgi:cellobiose-specific phosphotransferase system component IIC